MQEKKLTINMNKTIHVRIFLVAICMAMLWVGASYIPIIRNFFQKDACLDQGGRFDQNTKTCRYATNTDGTSPYERIEGCEVDKVVALQNEVSKETLCKITTISGYSDDRLIVIDKLEDNRYIVRILGSVDKQHEVYREEVKRDFPFELYFSHFPAGSGKSSLIVLDRNGPALVGFPHRDENGFKIFWKL